MKAKTTPLYTITNLLLLLLLAPPKLTFAYLSNKNTITLSTLSKTTLSRTSNGVCRQPPPPYHGAIAPPTSPLFDPLHSYQQSSSKSSSTILYSTTPSNNNNENKFNVNERALGILVLMTVPLSWGTYAPVVKYVYEINPPVPGFVFSAGYYVVASLTLLTLASLTTTNDDDTRKEGVETMEEGGVEEGMDLPIQGGLELGLYLFLGNALQVIGLKTVPADRAAFLVQLTTIMVPLVQATLVEKNLWSISIKTWVACLLAFSGVVVMGLDGKEMSGGDSVLSSLSSIVNTFTSGDLLIVSAAFVYTLHVVRLGRYAPYTTPIRLAASKATTEAILSVGLVLALLFLTGSDDQASFVTQTSHEISTFFTSIQNSLTTNAIPITTLLPAVGAILWTGWITCAYTIYAQSFGQRRVSPTDANLIYTTQPLFSALFAWGILGETLGKEGYVGAGLIGAALWLVTDSGGGDGRDKKDEEVDYDGGSIGRANLPLRGGGTKRRESVGSALMTEEVEKIQSTR
uniref:EamA domain-containing protein n=1 Tax=Helicotheca tamesis TaxID=374047 RepID=A0A7S2HES8_9STRA|mmetsp:Transcript_17470/g.24094  ORF Transcript_17470/g.24094 Transcript_17470/m.24094 type:complete len:516 (+) Transcript_17470:127-1674(+)